MFSVCNYVIPNINQVYFWLSADVIFKKFSHHVDIVSRGILSLTKKCWRITSAVNNLRIINSQMFTIINFSCDLCFKIKLNYFHFLASLLFTAVRFFFVFFLVEKKIWKFIFFFIISCGAFWTHRKRRKDTFECIQSLTIWEKRYVQYGGFKFLFQAGSCQNIDDILLIFFHNFVCHVIILCSIC